MTHRTDFPSPEAARATNLNGDILVYMPWGYFRAPVLNLQHQTKNGEKDLIDVAPKFRAVPPLPNPPKKIGSQRNRSGSLTAEWLNVWGSLTPKTKPSPCT
jgi:hypothetical protein